MSIAGILARAELAAFFEAWPQLGMGAAPAPAVTPKDNEKTEKTHCC